MFVAVICIWLGCVIVFLSAKSQQVIAKPLSKQFAWLVFGGCLVFSIYWLSQELSSVVASLLSLAYVMVIWLLLVFSQGHIRLSLIKLSGAAVTFSAAAHWLGA